MSKSQKCSKARNSNDMNHSLGRTPIDKWKDNHVEAFGKPPNVAQVFDKAYMGKDPLKQLDSSTTNEEEGEGSQPGIVYSDDRRAISADLHRYYDEAIMTGSDESTANTQTILKIFGKTKRLGIDSSGPSKQRSRLSSSSSNIELEVLKEQVATKKKKQEELEHKFESLLNYLQENGLMPPDKSNDHHAESSDNHTESNEEHMD